MMRTDNTSNQTITNSSPANSNKPEKSEDTTASGRYVDYNKSVIAQTSGTKVLFFHATWCPQCRALDASIKSGSTPSGVTIIKVDYDTNQALRKKYGVTLQTTLVKVDDNGELVEKYVAYEEPTLEALKQNIL